MSKRSLGMSNYVSIQMRRHMLFQAIVICYLKFHDPQVKVFEIFSADSFEVLPYRYELNQKPRQQRKK